MVFLVVDVEKMGTVCKFIDLLPVVQNIQEVKWTLNGHLVSIHLTKELLLSG